MQVRGDNTKYRRYRVQVASKQAIAREKGERRVRIGYMVCCDVRARPSLFSPDVVGSYIYIKTPHAKCQLARLVGLAKDGERQKSTAYHEDDRPGEATQRTLTEGDTNNRLRGAMVFVLARALANAESEELRSIVGVEVSRGESAIADSGT